MMTDWHVSSWRNFPVRQQPDWPGSNEFELVLQKISTMPALVFAGETRALKEKLAEAEKGEAIILQCGDCAEEFTRCTGPKIHALLKVILQMSTILAFSGEKSVINIGRMAGQFVKPRSKRTEVVNGVEIPSYFGDMINSVEATPDSRIPNPQRVLEGYYMSAATLNLIRAFTKGGYGSLKNVSNWHRNFASNYSGNIKYIQIAEQILKAIRFFETSGFNSNQTAVNEFPLFTSHEALLLDYEESLTRIDTTTGQWYDTSAHFLWVGARTNQSEGAHIEFLRGVNNPVGIKVGPTIDVDDLIKTIAKLNPLNESGKIVLINRLGVEFIDKKLAPIIEKVKDSGFNVCWVCDPMHGNTYKLKSGKKTRHLSDILEEIRQFFKICHREGVYPAGVHLELTGEMVTECLGGDENLKEEDLTRQYTTACDPRLNLEQSIELAFELAELIKPTIKNGIHTV
jgi:3-deoxy-7-phosphoheptulonate synthase